MERFIEIGDGGNGGNVGDGMKLLRHDVGARREGEGHHLALSLCSPVRKRFRDTLRIMAILVSGNL